MKIKNLCTFIKKGRAEQFNPRFMPEVKKIVRKKLIIRQSLKFFVETINFSGTKLLTNNVCVCAHIHKKHTYVSAHKKKRGKKKNFIK